MSPDLLRLLAATAFAGGLLVVGEQGVQSLKL